MRVVFDTNVLIAAFLPEGLCSGLMIRARKLATLIRQEFDLKVHPRTIERALGVKKTAR